MLCGFFLLIYVVDLLKMGYFYEFFLIVLFDKFVSDFVAVLKDFVTSGLLTLTEIPSRFCFDPRVIWGCSKCSDVIPLFPQFPAKETSRKTNQTHSLMLSTPIKIPLTVDTVLTLSFHLDMLSLKGWHDSGFPSIPDSVKESLELVASSRFSFKVICQWQIALVSTWEDLVTDTK